MVKKKHVLYCESREVNVLEETDVYRNLRSRKWLLTINNPIDKGYTHEHIKEILSKFKIVYWCMSDETGSEGTFHTHIFLASNNGIRATTLQDRFEGAHRDIARGTCQQNRDYVFKEGKWLDSEKGTTNHRDTHEEWGEMPIERPGARNDLADLFDAIRDGQSTYEILRDSPQYIMHVDKIERVRQIVIEEQHKNDWRNLSVTYVWGVTGKGKTRGVMERYGYSNVYRVTDYDHPFDGYKGQDVLLFDEFRSSLPISNMLDYLDGYPVELRARYTNKQACYTKVYIISNIDICEQYHNVQREEPRTWQAFLRRINEVQTYTETGVVSMNLISYMSDFKPCMTATPFDKDKVKTVEKEKNDIESETEEEKSDYKVVKGNHVGYSRSKNTLQEYMMELSHAPSWI